MIELKQITIGLFSNSLMFTPKIWEYSHNILIDMLDSGGLDHSYVDNFWHSSSLFLWLNPSFRCRWFIRSDFVCSYLICIQTISGTCDGIYHVGYFSYLMAKLLTSWYLGVSIKFQWGKPSNACMAIDLAGQNKTTTPPSAHPNIQVTRNGRQQKTLLFCLCYKYATLIISYFATILLNLCQGPQETNSYNSINNSKQNHTATSTTATTTNTIIRTTTATTTTAITTTTLPTIPTLPKLRSLQSKDLRASHRQRLLLKLRNAQFRCGVRKSASSPERRLQEGLQRLVEDNSVQESLLEAAGVGGCGMFEFKKSRSDPSTID